MNTKTTRHCPTCGNDVIDDKYVFCSESCGDTFFPPEPDVYCIIMDSGAAWHINGLNMWRCPDDGCGQGH